MNTINQNQTYLNQNVAMFDENMAIQHLELLYGEPNPKVCFLSLPDSPALKHRNPIQRHGTLTELLPELKKLSAQGYGIFVTVNRTDGKGRKKSNIVQFNACWAESDAGAVDKPFPIPPTFIVWSKNGPHYYWCLIYCNDTSAEQIERFNKQITKQFLCDESVTDVARVLRLAGTLHQKDRQNPFGVRLEVVSGIRYQIEDLCREFGVMPDGVLRNPESNSRSKKAHNGSNTGGALRAPTIDVECERIRTTPAGEKTNQAFKSACSIGIAIQHSEIDIHHAKKALIDSAVESGLSEIEATETVEKGIATGISHAVSNAAAPREDKTKKLLDLAQKLFSVVRTKEGTIFIDSSTYTNNSILKPANSKDTERLLRGAYYDHYKTTVGQRAVKDVIATLEALAHKEPISTEVHLRMAQANDQIFVHLADDADQIVTVTPTGYYLTNNAPVKFVKKPGMLDLPIPVGGGHVGELLNFVNIYHEDFPLLLTWMIGCFIERGPFFILALSGEQGTAKSTSVQFIRKLIDPNKVMIRMPPKDERDLCISAANSWILAYDNLSGIKGWLSDGLCCVATGGGFSTRTLYTDCDETLIEFKRPIILNGIESVGNRSDFMDRMMMLETPMIDDSRRKMEAALNREFEVSRSRILGALLQLVSQVLHALPLVNLPSMPRMADAYRIGVAIEMAMQWPQGTFTAAYARNRDILNATALEASPVFPMLQRLLASRGGQWEGTASDLLSELVALRGAHPDHDNSLWPKDARGMSSAIKRIAPNLRRSGISVEFFRINDRMRTRCIRLREIEQRLHVPPTVVH